MTDPELAPFLEWAAPRLGLRWLAFANFRGTVRKRIRRRIAELGLADLAAYRLRLEEDPREWAELDAMLRITISRLWRDADVMEALRDEVFPSAAERARRDGRAVRVWSAGCASGEEPYTIAIVYRLGVAPSYPDVRLEVLASDVDPELVERARRGAYESGSLRELPPPLRDAALVREGGVFVVREEVRRAVTFEVRDIRKELPQGPFDVVMCRNVAFTYFDARAQLEVGARLVALLSEGGVLVVGAREAVPSELGLTSLEGRRGLWQRPDARYLGSL